MKVTTALAASAGLVSFANALNLQKRADGPARVIGMDLHRRTVTDPAGRDRLRRRNGNSSTISETLDNEETLYFANVTLGTPGQQLRLHIDTGSSDLWSNVDTSEFCQQNNDPCGQSGTYNPNKSSTYQYVNSMFNISYEDGSGASGDYGTDDLNIGGATVKNLQIGVGYQSSSQEGLLGIGYADNEAIVQFGDQPYVNTPQAMVQQGLIQAQAYSLWLNDLDANEGQVLFGGVNTEKYTGDLSTLPIIQEEGSYIEFIVGLSGLGINKANSLASGQQIAVLLDSGSSLMYLPNSIVQDIYNEFDAQYDESQQVATVPCSLANNQSNLIFTFSGPSISVPMSELVLQGGTNQKNEPICILGIGPADGSTCVLGDTFIRSAYIVYDLDSNEISIAQTKFNSTQDNIMEITNGTSGVPSAAYVTGAISTADISGLGSNPQITNPPSKAAAAPLITAAPVLGQMAGAAMAGAGLLMAL